MLSSGYSAQQDHSVQRKRNALTQITAMWCLKHREKMLTVHAGILPELRHAHIAAATLEWS